MKEISIEEKAKAYDEAVERVENIKNGKCKNTFMFTEGLFDYIFPELEESEEERIRKYLSSFVELNSGVNLPPEDAKDILAWIEKQGEHANFRNKIQVGDKVTRNKDRMLVNLSLLNRVAKKGEQKPADIADKLKEEYQKGWDAAMQQLPKEVDSQIWQIANNSAKTWEESFAILYATQKSYDKGRKDASKEQNPAWSEEDERIYNRICDIVHAAAFANYDVDEDGKECGEYAKIIGWFKDLKDRVSKFDDGYKVGFSAAKYNQWEPSEEQMKALDIAIRCGIQLGTWEETSLKDLYNDLKKL